MTEMGTRLRKGLMVAVGVHLVVAALLGYFTFLGEKKLPPQIIEITLAGGGGGGGGTKGQSAAAKPKTSSSSAQLAGQDAEAIVEKKIATQDTEQQDLNETKATAPDAEAADTGSNTETDDSATTGEDGNGGGTGGGTGSGNGIGTGSGTGSGSGSGSGSGNGSGNGSGSGSGYKPGTGVPVTPPRFLSGARPSYPNVQRNREVQGSVAIRMVVGPGGSVESAGVVGSSGNGQLDSAALSAVYSWRFSPARDTYGNPCRCGITMPVTFALR